ncbi:hypothetical protein FRC03_006850 [Tulasnella sp. 419]|nr:hypothetical protein FRC03_006850 [Tulasnella sp. 419]
MAVVGRRKVQRDLVFSTGAQVKAQIGASDEVGQPTTKRITILVNHYSCRFDKDASEESIIQNLCGSTFWPQKRSTGGRVVIDERRDLDEAQEAAEWTRTGYRAGTRVEATILQRPLLTIRLYNAFHASTFRKSFFCCHYHSSPPESCWTSVGVDSETDTSITYRSRTRREALPLPPRRSVSNKFEKISGTEESVLSKV